MEIQGGQYLHQCCFPRSISSQQAEHTVFNGEGNVVQCCLLPVVLFQGLDLYFHKKNSPFELITAQDRAEAVNYFYKGKKEKEHFGIGLTICKILAEKHGGTISLDNVPDSGARVTVKLKIEEISPL